MHFKTSSHDTHGPLSQNYVHFKQKATLKLPTLKAKIYWPLSRALPARSLKCP